VEDILEIFKTLSDETRLRILKLLEHGELCVCGIVAALDMIQPKISFHLGVLRDAKFISDRRQGKWIYYRIDDTDLFRRFLILSILEKIPEDTVSEDKKRLQKFSENKKSQEATRAITERRAEC
jgi:ArsR family transcriptional regulator, arsenate/arsenite/antimonite-responsive transcriptional repressor